MKDYMKFEIRWSPDLPALKLWKGSSGDQENGEIGVDWELHAEDFQVKGSVGLVVFSTV